MTEATPSPKPAPQPPKVGDVVFFQKQHHLVREITENNESPPKPVFHMASLDGSKHSAVTMRQLAKDGDYKAVSGMKDRAEALFKARHDLAVARQSPSPKGEKPEERVTRIKALRQAVSDQQTSLADDGFSV